MPLNTLMKSLIKPLVFVGLVTLTTALNAQTTIQKPVVCDLTTKITAVLMDDEIKERLVWAGVNQRNSHTFLLMANDKTGTWTFLEIAEQWACILAMGDRFSLDSLESILKSTK
jgi:hypothetical protein